MTPSEVEMVNCLQRVTYPAASWDKRFTRSMAGASGITEKESPQVWRLFKKYRRQISTPYKGVLLQMAEELAAPDFRKKSA